MNVTSFARSRIVEDDRVDVFGLLRDLESAGKVLDLSPSRRQATRAYVDAVSFTIQRFAAMFQSFSDHYGAVAQRPSLITEDRWRHPAAVLIVGLRILSKGHLDFAGPSKVIPPMPSGCQGIRFALSKLELFASDLAGHFDAARADLIPADLASLSEWLHNVAVETEKVLSSL